MWKDIGFKQRASLVRPTLALVSPWATDSSGVAIKPTNAYSLLDELLNRFAILCDRAPRLSKEIPIASDMMVS
jgi:hypothetical protein